jgi:hypothetical protein
MQYITRERFEKIIRGKDKIDLEELVMVIENEFGYSVKLEEKKQADFTEGQKTRMTDLIFSNEQVLKQLRKSSKESEDDYIDDEETFMRIIKEAADNG